ncbi:nSTAND1 domain-containing NTPase [Geodermatophilus sp. SYSU D01176]
MARVFLSHASADGGLAATVHGWLRAAGHDVFLDQDLQDGIAAGEEWEQRLLTQLRRADAVVCVVTSAYTRSVWCTAEVVFARSRGSRLVPVLAEPGVRHPLLTALQHVDATEDEDRARAGLAGALVRLDAAGGRGWPDDRSPFPGLRPFDVDQHRVFFGRERDVEQLAALLRSPAERADGSALLVVGPSGCGKSSLVRAGLLPVVAEEPEWWTLSPFLPGTDPVGALTREISAAARLLGRDWSLADVRRRLDEGGLTELADELLLAVPGHRRRRLLVVADQFEEVLTQTAPSERSRFAALLRPALTGPVQLVATLRPEFLEPLLTDPELTALPKRIHPVQPLRREALRAVVEEPARLAGIEVDDDLVTRLVADTDSGEALPLLAYTLAELAEGIGRGGRLPTSRYEQLGGVQGALTRQAEGALADATAATGRSRDQVVKELLRLVTVDEHGRPTRWRVPRDELPDQVATELDAFVARRLLTTDREDDRVVVGVAHEAFLTAWPPLHAAIDAASTALRARRAVEQAAAEWAAADEPPSRLWERGQLAAALADTGARLQRGRPHGTLVADRVELSARAREFLRSSIRRDRHRRRRSTVVLSVLLVLALAGAAVAMVQRDAAERNQREAVARQLVAQADAARTTAPRTAMLLGIAAEAVRPGPEARSGLVETLTHTLYARTLPHDDDVVSVAFTEDGRALATGGMDGSVVLWDVVDPAHPRPAGRPLNGHRTYVYSVAYSPDGHVLASGSADGTVVLWDVTDPARAQVLGGPLAGHTDQVHAAVFSPDGRTLATGSADGTVLLWDVADPARPRRLGDPLPADSDRVTTVDFSPDGRTLASAGFDGAVRLWDVADRAAPRPIGEPLTGHRNAVWEVAFAPGSLVLATASADGTALLWDVADPARPRRLGQPLAGHVSQMYSLAFALDGRTLATASADRTVRLWDVADPADPQPLGEPLTGHTGYVYAVAFAPDGRTLASGSADHTVVLWDLADPVRPRPLGEPLTGLTDDVYAVSSAREGQVLAGGATDGTVRVWAARDGARPGEAGRIPAHPDGGARPVALTPEGRTLATAGPDGAVALWDLTDPSRPRPSGEPLSGHFGPVNAVTFSSGGDLLASAGADGTVRLWDVADPARPRALADPLEGHTGQVSSVAFAPEGRLLASGGSENAVFLWDLTDRTGPRRLGPALTDHAGPVTSVAFAPDGRTLAAGGADHTVLLWDVADPDRPGRLGQVLTAHTSRVSSVAFAPDGRTLASGSADGAVALWDLTDRDRPRPLGRPLDGHGGSVNAVAFADDATLVSGSWDQAVRLWDLGPLRELRDRPAERACAITGRGLDPEEWDRYIEDLDHLDTCAR